MAIAVTMDVDGVAATVYTSMLQWNKEQTNNDDTVKFHYLIVIPFRLAGINRMINIRLYTETLAAMTYQASNSAGITAGIDMVTSDTILVDTSWDDGKHFVAASDWVFTITSLAGSLVDATFSGTLNLFENTAMTYDPSALTPTDTIAITNGVMTDVPYT